MFCAFRRFGGHPRCTVAMPKGHFSVNLHFATAADCRCRHNKSVSAVRWYSTARPFLQSQGVGPLTVASRAAAAADIVNKQNHVERCAAAISIAEKAVAVEQTIVKALEVRSFGQDVGPTNVEGWHELDRERLKEARGFSARKADARLRDAKADLDRVKADLDRAETRHRDAKADLARADAQVVLSDAAAAPPLATSNSSVTAPRAATVQSTAHSIPQSVSLVQKPFSGVPCLADTRVVEALLSEQQDNVRLRQELAQRLAECQAAAADRLRFEQESARAWKEVDELKIINQELAKVIQALRDENVRLQQRLDNMEATLTAMQDELQRLREDRFVVLAAQAVALVNEDFRREMQQDNYSMTTVAANCRNLDEDVRPELWAAYLTKHQELNDKWVRKMLAYVPMQRNQIAHPADEARTASRKELFEAFKVATRPQGAEQEAGLNSLVDFVWSVRQEYTKRVETS